MNTCCSHPRILIVEDDEDQRMLILEALSIYFNDPEGRSFLAVGTAGQCLAEDLGKFDVVLQDYHLPDMSGLQLLEKITARVDLPVIFVTGENDSAVAAQAIQSGAQDYVVKLGDYLFALPILVEKNIRQHSIKQENKRLQRELQSMLSELRVKNVQLRESLAQQEKMAATDPLTGLANRRRFSEVLERTYSEAVRYRFDVTCCMCDLDHYKALNDACGHQVGDEILVLAAEIICSSLRSSDIAARYGGDEFVLLLPHTSIDRGQSVSRRIRDELAEHSAKHDKLPSPVHLSMGIASLNTHNPTTVDELVAMADRALYMAKERGRNRIVVFDRELTVGMRSG